MDVLDYIKKAKDIMGDEAASIIAEGWPLENWDGVSKASSPYSSDSNPSCMWNKKEKCFKDFSTGRVIGITDYYMHHYDESYKDAIIRLCNETGVEIPKSIFGSTKDGVDKNYVYPVEESNRDRTCVNEYCKKRGISVETLDIADVKQDKYGNVVFELRNLDGVLMCTKYRPSHGIKNGEPKMWWQKNADTCPLLYNIKNVRFGQPLLITEGYFDCLSAIEAGYTNVVSIPGGAEDTNWIEFNYEFLKNFSEYILWYDNDTAGKEGCQKVVKRLGEYKCKIVEVPEPLEDAVEYFYDSEYGKKGIRKTDANNILLACGSDAILEIIRNAKEIENPLVKHLMDYEEQQLQDMPKISTGFKALDRVMYGNFDNSFTVLTGRAGCVDCDTEFFDGKGWKKISEYKEGEKILQYNKDGTTSMITPLLYHKYKCDNLWQFETKYGINQCLSDEHNVYYITSKGNLAHKKFVDVKKQHDNSTKGFEGKFIKAFYYDGCGISLTDEDIETAIKTMCAFFRFSPDEDGIDSCWYNCSNSQLHVVCNSILSWGQCIDEDGKKVFVTAQKDTADFVQFAFTACGYSASIRYKKGKEENTVDTYLVLISDNKYESISDVYDKKVKINPYTPKDGFKYCFTTYSGMWVMRRNNCIVVTGNCGKSTFLNQFFIAEPMEAGERVFVYSGELPARILLGNILRPLASQRHIMQFDNGPDQPKGYVVTKQASSVIKKFYRDNLFVFDDLDDLDTNGGSLLDTMEYCYKKYNITSYVIDNLMTVDMRGIAGENKLDCQIQFVKKLKKFTRMYPVKVLLVAHARKLTPGSNAIGIDDISGASEITKICDRCYNISALKDEDDMDSRITVIKDRQTGHVGTKFDLYYDPYSSRIYTDEAELNKKYRWERETPKINYTDFENKNIVSNIPALKRNYSTFESDEDRPF